MKKYLLLVIFLIISMSPIILGQDSGRPRDSFKILVLHSYSENFSWTESINQGLRNRLSTDNFDIQYEYMDSKRYNDDEYHELLSAILAYKYSNNDFDLVVTSDNAAYEFYSELRTQLFGEPPSLHIGLNGQVDTSERWPQSSYIIEELDFYQTIELALTQYPAASHINIVIDSSLSGSEIKKQILLSLPDDIPPITWLQNLEVHELLSRIQNINENDLLFYGIYFTDGTGSLDNAKVLQNVVEASPVPVYCFWSFSLDEDVLGGYVYDAHTLGEKAAEIIQQYREAGESTELITNYIDSPFATHIYNYDAIVKFGMQKKTFPPEAVIINRPVSYFEQNKTLILAFTAIFIVMTVIITLIHANLRTQTAINSFNGRLMETQKEIMVNLSTVIESRSKETAAHIRRVTGITRFLGEKLGLTGETLDTLFFGATLHDVGKVAIPDEILKKPGALTPEERSEMETHTERGYEILSTSGNNLLKQAAVVALQHHEHWNGNGYPAGLAGEKIHVLARIVTIADIVESLLSERVYKEAWDPSRVKEYVTLNRGVIFDPDMSATVLENWDEIIAICNQVKP